MTIDEKKRQLALNRLQQADESLDEANDFINAVREYLVKAGHFKKKQIRQDLP
jgi:flagellin-like hook-associated protein FlgL